MMATMTSSSGTKAIVKLYSSLNKKCTQVTDDEFDSVLEQIDQLLTRHIPDLNKWYTYEFEPAIKQYEQSVAKCKDIAIKQKQLAKWYSVAEEECFANKAFEYINRAIRFTPTSENELLCECYYLRSGLHQIYRKNLEAAAQDMARALHFSPDSVQCSRMLDHLLEELPAEKRQHLNMKMQQLVLNETNTESESKQSHQIQLDPRVEMLRDSENGRFKFRTNQLISTGEKLLVEDPSMLILKRDAWLTHCSSCLKKCSENECWPCLGCTEVVFCSLRCAKIARKEPQGHSAECGFIGLLHNEISSKTLQVYRMLVQTGHAELLQMDKEVNTYEKYLNELKDNVIFERVQVAKWFCLAQCDVRHQLQRRQPTRSATELAVAVFVLSLYRYKNAVASLGTQEEVAQLLCILATEQAKLSLTEFGWHEYESGKRLTMGAFQCLVGSNLNHSCEKNTNWNYVEGKLVLTSNKNLSVGDTISISYSNVEGKSFYERQTFVQRFTVRCHCTKCSREVLDHLAFRCTECDGPVPFDAQLHHGNPLACMRCEKPYQYKILAKSIKHEFRVTQRMLWLLQVSSNQGSDQLKTLVKQMDTLCGYIDPQNLQWLQMLVDMCELFCAKKFYHKVIEWLQWLVDRFDLYLGTGPHLTQLEQLHQTGMWISAYIEYLRSTKDDEQYVIRCVRTGEHMFRKMFALLEQIKYANFNDHIADEAAVLKSLHQKVLDKWQRFVQITGSKVVIAQAPNVSVYEIDDSIELTRATSCSLNRDPH